MLACEYSLSSSLIAARDVSLPAARINEEEMAVYSQGTPCLYFGR